jgi:hypothetical protein
MVPWARTPGLVMATSTRSWSSACRFYKNAGMISNGLAFARYPDYKAGRDPDGRFLAHGPHVGPHARDVNGCGELTRLWEGLAESG